MRESFEEEIIIGMGGGGTASERVREYFAQKLKDVKFPVNEEEKKNFSEKLQAAVGDFYEDYRAKLVGVTEYREYIEELKKDNKNEEFVKKVEQRNALEIRTKEQIKKLATSVEPNGLKEKFIDVIISTVIANCQPFPVRDTVDALSIKHEDTDSEIKEESPEQARLLEDNWLEHGKFAPIFLAIHPVLFSFPSLSPDFWNILTKIEAKCHNQETLRQYLVSDEFIGTAIMVAKREMQYAMNFAKGDWGQVIKEKPPLKKAQQNVEKLSNLQEEINKLSGENIIEEKRVAVKSVLEKSGELKVQETQKMKSIREQNEKNKNKPLDRSVILDNPSKKKFQLKNLFKKKYKKLKEDTSQEKNENEIDLEGGKKPSFFSKAGKKISKTAGNIKAKVKGFFKKEEEKNPLLTGTIEWSTEPQVEPKKNSTSDTPIESNIDIEEDEKTTLSKKLRKLKTKITDFVTSEDSAGDEAFKKKLPSMNKVQVDKEIEKQNTLVSEYNDKLISSSPSKTGGLIRLLCALVGAAIGFAVGGPLGAILGAGLGYMVGQGIENTVAPALEKKHANANLKRAESRVKALEERRETLIEKERTESKGNNQNRKTVEKVVEENDLPMFSAVHVGELNDSGKFFAKKMNEKKPSQNEK